MRIYHEAIKFSLGLALILLTGCQKEEVFRVEEDTIPEELAAMVIKVATHDGSYDDIVDGGNCYSINLPFDIEHNDRQRTIKDVADYYTLQESDKILVKFPVTVTFHDHHQQIISSQTELLELASDCKDNDDDIECIDFIYPFQLQTFDEFAVELQTVEVFHDKQIFEFITSMKPATKLKIKYPIDLALYNGIQKEAGHNESLMQVIIDAVGACDEDD